MTALPRILVVDDNSGDLTLLNEAVMESRVPIRLTTCRSAMQALSLVQYDPSYELILSDINMPGMTGLEFLHALAKMPQASTIPLVLMSSSTRDALPSSLNGSLAAVPYFTKPRDWRGFLQLAQTLVSAVRDGGTSEDAGEVLGAHVRTPSARLRSAASPNLPGSGKSLKR
jgi:CheY-like chemotaxis protein